MKWSVKRWVATGVLAFLVFLLINLPGSIIEPYLENTPARISGITGSIWNGNAQNFSVDQLQFGHASWRWKATGLLKGRMEFEFQTGNNDPYLSGRFGMGLDGRLHAENCRLEMSLEQLGRLPYEATANIILNIETLILDGQWPDHATGTFLLSNTSINIPKRLDLGDFNGRFEIANGSNLVAAFHDLDGALEINGQLDLDAQGNFFIDGLITPRGQISARLRYALSFLPREAGGEYPINFSGSL